MSRSPSSSTSASTGNTVCKPAEKQTSITRYFELRSDRPKRRRRNLEETGQAKKPTVSDAQGVAVEEDNDPYQFVPANDDKCDPLRSDTKLEVECVPDTPAKVSFNAAGRSETAVLRNSVPEEMSSQLVKSFAVPVHEFYHAATSEHQATVEEVNRHGTARSKFCESDEDEAVQNDDLLPADIPSPSEADAEFSSKLTLAGKSIGDGSEDTETYSLQSDQRATRRQLMEKVINVSLLHCTVCI